MSGIKNDLTFFFLILLSSRKDKNKNKSSQLKITKIHHKIDEVVDYLYENELCPAVIFVLV